MKTGTYPCKGRALRRVSILSLTLFFYMLCTDALQAAESAMDTTISNYVAKMALSLLVLLLLGFLAIRFLPGKLRSSAQGKMKLLGAISLGRDALYAVQIGPDVIALLVSRSGSTVVGKWSSDEWDDAHCDGVPASDNVKTRGIPR